MVDKLTVEHEVERLIAGERIEDRSWADPGLEAELRALEDAARSLAGGVTATLTAKWVRFDPVGGGARSNTAFRAGEGISLLFEAF